MCPIVAGAGAASLRDGLPYLLYLPGIDGTGLAAYKQFPALCRNFHFEALSVPPHDRTWFPGLLELVECPFPPRLPCICFPLRVSAHCSA